MTSQEKKLVRDAAIKLLDDDAGVCEDGWNALQTLLMSIDCEDICNRVDSVDGRFYLNSESIKDLE